MKIHRIGAIAIVVLLIVAGAAAAAPGNAPDDIRDGTVPPLADDDADERAQNDTDAKETADDARENGMDERDERVQGPPTSLPEQVPDHVSRIHDLIRQFIDGSLDGNLGDAISGVTPDDGDESQNADSQSD